MNARIALVLVVLGTSLVLPLTAGAHRPATAAEKKAVRAAVAAYIKKPSSHAAGDNTVTAVWISTVDPHFAGAKLTSVSGDSTALLKGSGTSWKVIGFSPSQKCSLAPRAVRNDLSILCGQK